MIVIITIDRQGGSIEPRSADMIGLSTDEKPTGTSAKNIPNGTLFIEMDTATGFFYDKENDVWIEV